MRCRCEAHDLGDRGRTLVIYDEYGQDVQVHLWPLPGALCKGEGGEWVGHGKPAYYRTGSTPIPATPNTPHLDLIPDT